MADEVTILELGQPRLSNAPLPKMPPLVTPYSLTIGSTAAAVAFNASTIILGVHTTTGCNISIATTPSTGAKFPLPAGQWHFYDVKPGDSIKAYT